MNPGVSLSYLPFFMKAVSLSLKRFPIFNSHVDADCTKILQKKSHNIGVAMDSRIGLLVPNVKNVQELSVLEIAKELNRLQNLVFDVCFNQAKDGKLAPADLAGGTITISNIGAVGGTYMKPLLLCPQIAICAIGKHKTIPRYDEDGNIVPLQIGNITWAGILGVLISGDHRVLDGATMAKFSNSVKEYIENPDLMILHCH